jgi:hypothetical protein
MHAFIDSHLLCAVLAAACAATIAVRAIRDYREYHPRTSLSNFTRWSAFRPRSFQTGREPSAR